MSIIAGALSRGILFNPRLVESRYESGSHKEGGNGQKHSDPVCFESSKKDTEAEVDVPKDVLHVMKLA